MHNPQPGTPPMVEQLARELRTSDRGTTLTALAEVAGKHGLRARGLALTQKGLEKQKLPLIALVAPGHYVLVEGVRRSAFGLGSGGEVTIWDPDGRGAGKPDRKSYSVDEWGRIWTGIALVVD